MKILYVEDNQDNIYVLEHRLKRQGHTVVIACDGASGVQFAAIERPDVILMDLSLPVIERLQRELARRPFQFEQERQALAGGRGQPEGQQEQGGGEPASNTYRITPSA